VDDPSPEVFVAVFDDAAGARRAARDLAAVEHEGVIALLALVVIVREAGGDVEWHTRGPALGHLSARADTIATMLGVLLPSPVQVAGLTAAADRGPAGREAERDFERRFAHEVAGALRPGGSVVVAVIDDRWTGEVERGLRGYHRLERGSAA
jgi:uncharacterized membrane protein